MINIKVTTSFPQQDLLNQTPGKKGEWGACRFFVNQDVESCDYWMVYEGLKQEERCRCPRENIFFFTGEPEIIKRYNTRFLAQFARVYSCNKRMKHPNIIYSQPSLPWYVGKKYNKQERRWNPEVEHDYDSLSRIMHYDKKKELSVILSQKKITSIHRKRIAFVHTLKKHFGDRLDIFGIGFGEIEDKWDAIADYKYHLVLEVCASAHYWSEKLADAFLGGAYPFYYGCTNIDDYFSPHVLTKIDLDNPVRSIALIEEEIAQNTYEKSRDEIIKAKDLILNTYNMFPRFSALCRDRNKSTADEVVIKPEHGFRSVAQRAMLRAQKTVNRVLQRNAKRYE